MPKADESGGRKKPLGAYVRGQMLGEAPPPARPGAAETKAGQSASVFSLISEKDRERLMSLAAQAGKPDKKTSVPPAQAPPPAPPAPLFQGMHAALNSRFAVEGTGEFINIIASSSRFPFRVSKEKIGNGRGKKRRMVIIYTFYWPLFLSNGWCVGTKGKEGEEKKKEEAKRKCPEPTRTTSLWHPSTLLCKRFNVPAPAHAITYHGGQGRPTQAGKDAATYLPTYTYLRKSNFYSIHWRRTAIDALSIYLSYLLLKSIKLMYFVFETRYPTLAYLNCCFVYVCLCSCARFFFFSWYCWRSIQIIGSTICSQRALPHWSSSPTPGKLILSYTQGIDYTCKSVFTWN